MSSGDDLEKNVVEWVIDHPESMAVFQQYGIDYSCAGKSLKYACLRRGINPLQVLAEINRAIEATSSGNQDFAS